MSLSFKKLFYVLASIIAGGSILSLAKGILIPFTFAVLFSFILYPIVKWLRKKKTGIILSNIIAMGGVTIIISGIIYLFSAQIVSIVKNFSNFQNELDRVFDISISFINDQVNIIPNLEVTTISEAVKAIFGDTGFVLVSDTLGFTSTFLSYLTLSIVFTFLILLYSRQITQSLVQFSEEENRDTFLKMLKDIQKVGQQYLTGMLILVLILGVLNSIGLFTLGIDYAIFFGFLAALLAIIPYIGSFMGGLIPTLYALIVYDSFWYPLGVMFIFWFIQFIEGNFLNPKIVGGSLHVNALFSILSLIAGSLLWGIPGMILFLPLTAMLRTISTYYVELKPLAMLIGDEESDQKSKWLQKIKSKITK